MAGIVHLVKLCVGTDSVEDLVYWQATPPSPDPGGWRNPWDRTVIQGIGRAAGDGIPVPGRRLSRGRSGAARCDWGVADRRVRYNER